MSTPSSSRSRHAVTPLGTAVAVVGLVAAAATVSLASASVVAPAGAAAPSGVTETAGAAGTVMNVVAAPADSLTADGVDLLHRGAPQGPPPPPASRPCLEHRHDGPPC